MVFKSWHDIATCTTRYAITVQQDDLVNIELSPMDQSTLDTWGASDKVSAQLRGLALLAQRMEEQRERKERSDELERRATSDF